MNKIKCRVGERIRVGDEVELVIESINGDTVGLGINAPRDVPVQCVPQTQDKPPLAERKREDETGKT